MKKDQALTRRLQLSIGRALPILLAGVIFATAGPNQLCACTAFVLQSSGRTLLGEGFDWHSGEGLVAFNQAGVGKKSILAEAMGAPPFEWHSRHASVTFTWIGLSLPTCGMNTAGLAVTALIDNQAEYTERSGHPLMSISQWKQYLLDTCATVSEALSSLDRLSINSLSRYGVHYLLADAGGASAAVQFRDGRAHIYQDATLPHPVLTDNHDLQGLTADIDDADDTRFHRAARMVQNARRSPPEALAAMAWQTFDQVRIPGYTRWNIIFDLSARQVHFKTDRQPQIRRIDIDTLAKIRSAPFHLLEINTPLEGEVNHAFRPGDIPLHRQRVAAADRLVRFTPAAYEVLDTYADDLHFVE